MRVRMFSASATTRDVRHVVRDKRSGFSLLELLICVAIIGILMAMYSVVLSKALRQAKSVAAAEALRQDNIEPILDKISRTPLAAYRYRLDTGKGNAAIITEMVFVVRTDAEFRAYWYTLIDPDQTEYPTYGNDGALFAFDPEGNVYELPRIRGDRSAGPIYPVAWDFISTRPSESALGEAGGNVLYSDGHIEYLQYPGGFPMTPVVARHSHEFMVAYR